MSHYEPITPETNNSSKKGLWLALGGCLFLALCVGCLVLLAVGIFGYAWYAEEQTGQAESTAQALPPTQENTPANPPHPPTLPPINESRNN